MEGETLTQMAYKSKAIILDIEGTITSIDFIREIVFPYAESHLEDFIMNNWKEVREIGLLLQQQSVDSKGNSGDVIPLPQVPSTENIDEIQNFQRALVSYVKQRMNANRNDPSMKKIQGLVLRNAFRSGDIIAEIYPDAVKALETWSLENKQVFTYSTGIRDVQIEFFKNTNFGNKAQFIKAFFDTSIGSKLEIEGYKFICDFAKVDPSEVVFFSDRPLEIAAAKKCGLRAIVVPHKPTDHPSSYRPISLTNACGKLMEKMITNRLNYFFETHKKISDFQAGFRNTIEQAAFLLQSIKDGFHSQKSTLTIYVDFKSVLTILFGLRNLSKKWQIWESAGVCTNGSNPSCARDKQRLNAIRPFLNSSN
ncbi:enolase-phosphatase E1 [Trichonephila inaurata madagascariensis]|uniref:Enolase-phosphatase E1 n=1 Tax=Trichonephila inaurata madagascariensis TaxID=2747483 RepID=A0A8X6IHH6_9ARAC|nr:enolase-phosphatase E1 [Trichonephila inaurata madagascariensis]